MTASSKLNEEHGDVVDDVVDDACDAWSLSHFGCDHFPPPAVRSRNTPNISHIWSINQALQVLIINRLKRVVGPTNQRLLMCLGLTQFDVAIHSRICSKYSLLTCTSLVLLKSYSINLCMTLLPPCLHALLNAPPSPTTRITMPLPRAQISCSLAFTKQAGNRDDKM